MALESGAEASGSAHAIVVAPREVDIATSNTLRDDIDRAIHSNRWIIVDLSAVEFLDSTGLSALLAGHRLAEQFGGGLVLAGPSERTRRLLHITQLDAVLKIYSTVAEVPPSGS